MASATPTGTGTCTTSATLGDSAASASNISIPAGQTHAQKYTLAQDSIIRRIWIQPNTAAVIQVGIYSGTPSGNWPVSLLYSSAPVTVGPGLSSVTLPDVTLTAGTYWLAYENLSGTISFAATSSAAAEHAFVVLDFPGYWLECVTGVPSPTPTPVCTPPPYNYLNQAVLYADACY